MEKKIYDIISKNPVSLIKNFDKSFDFVKVFNAKVYFVQDSDIDTLTLYHSNLTKKYKSGYSVEKNIKFQDSDKVVYFSSQNFKKYLLEKLKEKTENHNFCSIIVLNNFDHEKLINSIIVNLWVKLYKKTITRPYLLLLTNSEYVPYVPFKLNSSNSIELPERVTNIEMYYSDKNYKLGEQELYTDMFQKIKEYHLRRPVGEDECSTWVIFCSQKNERKKFSKMIYNFFKKDHDVFSILNDSKYSSIKNISKTSRRGVRKFLIVDELLNIPICIKNIDGIFDCMTSSFELKLDIVNLYISKKTADKHIDSMTTGFCHRMCEESFYEKLPTVDVKDSERIHMDKYYLDIIGNNLNPYEIFAADVGNETLERELENLEKLFLIDKKDKENYILTELGDSVLKLPFNTKQNIVIENWKKQNKDLFPMLLLSCILETNGNVIYGNEIIHQFKSSDNLDMYLRIFNTIIEKYEGVQIPENQLKKFSKDHSLNYKIVELVFEKLQNFIEEEVEVKTFDISIFLKDCIPFFKAVYYEEIYRLIDSDKKLYSNGLNEISSLDSYNFKNPQLELPTTLIALNFTSLNTSKDSIQRRKKMISLFLRV